MAFKLKISEPFVVTQGPRYKDIGWGPYQEPSLGMADDGTVYAGVKMTEDSGAAYGAKHGIAFFCSVDGGETWRDVPREEWDEVAIKRAPKLPNGERVNVGMTPQIKVSESDLPKPAYELFGPETGRLRRAYLVSDIPDGIMHKGYFCDRYSSETKEVTRELTKVDWPEMIVVSGGNNVLNTPFPHGRLRVAPDGSVWLTHYARGLYPGTRAPSLFFNQYYIKSEDNAHSWRLESCIPFIPDVRTMENPYLAEGFCEADIAFMPDGSMITLMRSGGGSLDMKFPLYFSRSTDGGKNWSEPTVFDKFGVWPSLCVLPCGVTLASYGRPGFFIRATDAPDGLSWEEPIMLLSTELKEDAYEIPCCEPSWPCEWRSTCSYSDIIALDDNTALVIYTDFYYPDENGVPRKTVLCRKITVEKE